MVEKKGLILTSKNELYMLNPSITPGTYQDLSCISKRDEVNNLNGIIAMMGLQHIVQSLEPNHRIKMNFWAKVNSKVRGYCFYFKKKKRITILTKGIKQTMTKKSDGCRVIPVK